MAIEVITFDKDETSPSSEVTRPDVGWSTSGSIHKKSVKGSIGTRINRPEPFVLKLVPASWASERFKRLRSGTESQIIINRIVIGFSVFCYVITLRTLAGARDADVFLLISGVYACLGLLFLGDLVVRPQPSRLRIALQLLTDTSALSIGMHFGGQVAAPLYPIYLWAVLGYGLRFGLPWLRAATACAFLGFALCVATTPFWRHDLFLTYGLLGGLVAIPLYAASLLRSLAAAKHQAEEANKAKSQFLARVSHELRTPLNAVNGMTDLLAGTELDPAQQDMVRTTATAGRSLLSLIDDILDFARIESGNMPTQHVAFDLPAVIRTVERLSAASGNAKRLRVSSHISARTPARLCGDPRHLTEILLNMAGNAVKFTQHGSVLISVDAEERAGTTASIVIEISDTGIGIALEAQARIFDSFTQADKTIINSFGGTGLGLAIASKLVEMHGGRIRVTSKVGEGSTFRVMMPFRIAEPPPPSLPALRIAVISADPRLTGALVARLEDRGIAVVQQTIPREASPERLAMAVANTHGLNGVLIDGSSIPCSRSYVRDTLSIGARPPIILLETQVPEEAPDIDLRRGCLSLLRRDPQDLEVDNLLRAMAAWVDPEAAAPLLGRVNGLSMHVLVADDNRVNQQVVAKILDRGGHSYRIVANGEEALDALEDHPFDLVLMDVNMPTMDGIEATQLHRFGAVGDKHLPILAMTADATPEMAQRCIEAGMDVCIVKPVAPSRLLDIIDGFALTSAKANLVITPNNAEQAASARKAKAPVNPGVLKDLEMLGGPEFMAQIAQQFMQDASGLLAALRRAAELGETATFQAQAHALSGLAANIGADAVLAICARFQTRNLSDRSSCQIEMLSLKIELERVQQTLRQHVAGIR